MEEAGVILEQLERPKIAPKTEITLEEWDKSVEHFKFPPLLQARLDAIEKLKGASKDETEFLTKLQEANIIGDEELADILLAVSKCVQKPEEINWPLWLRLLKVYGVKIDRTGKIKVAPEQAKQVAVILTQEVVLKELVGPLIRRDMTRRAQNLNEIVKALKADVPLISFENTPIFLHSLLQKKLVPAKNM